ncbi:MAG: phosphoribosyl-ATP pyrophosphohydrolase, partial [Culicoidibacterales bacterium]
MKKTYNKLIRDRIVEIIEVDGKTATTRVLQDEEYETYLFEKMNEELAEFKADKNIEELADVMEVL